MLKRYQTNVIETHEHTGDFKRAVGIFIAPGADVAEW
jgi:hypothetical protein